MRALVLGLILVAASYGQLFGPKNASRLQGRDICDTAPTAGQGLVWSDGLVCWTPGTAGGGDNLGTAVALDIVALFSGSGSYLKTDGTRGTPGDTISPATSTNNYVALFDGNDSKTLKNGYPVSATPTPVAIPVSGASGTLPVGWIPTMIGDDGPGGATAAGGGVPAPAEGDAAAGKYLKADGVWTVPEGGAHTQGTDQGLDTGGANAVTAAEAKAAYTHSGVTTGNPHQVTKTDVGLGSVENTALSTWTGTANVALVGSTIQLGTAGPNLKNSSGTVEVRNAADGAYAALRALSIQTGDGTEAGCVTYTELVANGTEYIQECAPDAITTTVKYVRPNASPAGQVLSWGTPAGSPAVSIGSWITPLTSAYNQIIQDEGSSVAQRSTMDFVGAGVTVTDAGGKTTVTIPGGGGTSVPPYITSLFTDQTTVTVTGATHGFGTAALLTECYDNSSPRAKVEPNSVTVNASSYDVVFTFTAAQTGYCTIVGSGSAGDDTAYNKDTWDTSTKPPTQNTVRDQFEALAPSGVVAAANVPAITVTLTTSSPITVSTTLPAAMYFNQHTTEATAITYNLPTAAAGKQFCFSNSYGDGVTTGALTIATSAAGQYIIFTDGTLSASGGNVASGGAAADAACVVGLDATHWQLYVNRGAWVKN